MKMSVAGVISCMILSAVTHKTGDYRMTKSALCLVLLVSLAFSLSFANPQNQTVIQISCPTLINEKVTFGQVITTKDNQQWEVILQGDALVINTALDHQ